MKESKSEKKEGRETAAEDIKRYLPYRAKGDIDDFLFEGNCTLRHSER